MADDIVPVACPKCGGKTLEIPRRDKPTIDDFSAAKCAACGHVFDAKEAVNRLGIDKARELFKNMLRGGLKR